MTPDFSNVGKAIRVASRFLSYDNIPRSPMYPVLRLKPLRAFDALLLTRTVNNVTNGGISFPRNAYTSYSNNRSISQSTTSKQAQQQQQPPSPSYSEQQTQPTTTTTNISETGLSDNPSTSIDTSSSSAQEEKIDWTRSFHGLGATPFPKDSINILLAPTDPAEVEIKPDGIVYLPEIKYRRILNRAFGPGGWGLAPRSESIVTPKTVTREYALVCHGRYVSFLRSSLPFFFFFFFVHFYSK